MWWAILSALGLVVIVLPDTGRRLFSLSQGHGPSLVDGMGVLLLLAGWAVLDVATWRRRRRCSPRREVLLPTAAAGVAAVALVLWSVLGDHGAWWVVGAVLLAAIQLTAATKATLTERSPGGARSLQGFKKVENVVLTRTPACLYRESPRRDHAEEVVAVAGTLHEAADEIASVPVAVVGSRMEAELIVGMLRSNGLRVVVSADDAGGQYPQLQIEGVRVLVTPSDEASARQLLAAADDTPS